MNNKFTMELVWHNCDNNHPKEFENNSLIITNGKNVYPLFWHRAEGYGVVTANGIVSIRLSELENWWWADIEQTVQGDLRFKKEENNA